MSLIDVAIPGISGAVRLDRQRQAVPHLGLLPAGRALSRAPASALPTALARTQVIELWRFSRHSRRIQGADGMIIAAS